MDGNVCGCEDSVLQKTESMLLFSVLDKEARGQHGQLVQVIAQELRKKASAESQDGHKINKLEFQDALTAAAAAYVVTAMKDVAAKLSKDYTELEGNATGLGSSDRRVHPGSPLQCEEMER